MNLPFLTKITSFISGRQHHTTQARIEDGQLIFGFRGWLVEADSPKFDSSRLYLGMSWEQDKDSYATKHLYLCLFPALIFHAAFTDFG